MDASAIVDIPRRGVENMAIDQHLLRLAVQQQRLFLRFYRWSEPTLSLGYFQPLADRAAHEPSRDLAVVRRETGGGAIVHDLEVTYSITAPAQFAQSTIGASQPIYDLVHEALVRWLRQLGVLAERWKDADCKSNARACPFLCFERRSPGDVVVEGYKVVGSAQRRHRGGLLQHGSILLGRSPHAPSLPGIDELAARVGARVDCNAQPIDRLASTAEELCQLLMQSIRDRLGVLVAPERELEDIINLDFESSNFGNPEWTGRR